MKDSFLYKLLKKIDRHITAWLYIPPTPPLLPQDKIKVLESYAEEFQLQTLVETGTYEGETINALKDKFKKIISIELDEELYTEAAQRFSNSPHISIKNGDSGLVIQEVLSSLNEPALFWLDGHYSGDGTAKGNLDSPILKELKCIFGHPIKRHIILIDDARFFIGEGGYPKMRDISTHVFKNHPHTSVIVKNDIIRIIPMTADSSKPALQLYRESLRTKTWHLYRKFKRFVKLTLNHDKN